MQSLSESFDYRIVANPNGDITKHCVELLRPAKFRGFVIEMGTLNIVPGAGPDFENNMPTIKLAFKITNSWWKRLLYSRNTELRDIVGSIAISVLQNTMAEHGLFDEYNEEDSENRTNNPKASDI